MQLSGEQNSGLADIDQQAKTMPFRSVKQMAQRQGVTEQLKASDQMTWAGRMNNIRPSTMELVNKEIKYA